MKIAFLILAHDNWQHLNRLLAALDDEKHVFYVHIDKKVPMPNLRKTKAKLVLVDRVNVWWGGWSQQEAFNRLIKSALKQHFDYYVLLSGADYPIRPLSHLYKKLHKGGEYISINKGFSPSKPEWRIKYYHFDGSNRKNKANIKTIVNFSLEVLQRKLRLFRKKNFPFEQVYFGSSWWALSHECLRYVADHIENNPDWIRFYKTCWCPDESYIHTIIGNSPFLANCKGSLTYADWAGRSSSPAKINHRHVQMFIGELQCDNNFNKKAAFFARKFDDNSSGLVEEIDKHLRQQP